MGLTHERLVEMLEGIPGYGPYFTEAFGDDGITKERVAKAIADYERTRMAGNSAWDRWQAGGEPGRLRTGETGACAVLRQGGLQSVPSGRELHRQPVPQRRGRMGREDAHVQRRGPPRGHQAGRGSRRLQDADAPRRHDAPPYMHDGSVGTLREAVELYNRGGTKNPWLSAKIFPLGLTDAEIDALVAFMRALDSDLPLEVPPTSFPQ